MNTAKIPTPVNEPVLAYAPGSRERTELKQSLKDLSGRQIEIPVVIGGKEIRTGKTVDAVMPHCHRHVLAKVHQAGPEEVTAAVKAAREAWRDWSSWSLADRAAVFLKAADLLATRWRAMLNAATMLGQSKTAFQAEIDAACELIDFWRFNVHYAERIHAEQPLSVAGSGMCAGDDGVHGRLEAGRDSVLLELPRVPAVAGGGAAPRRHQLRPRSRRRDQ